MVDRERLLQRFLRYVAIDTTADETADVSPSSPGQLELGRVLVEELSELGLKDAQQDQHGIVTATVPGTTEADVPAVAFCAHLDTSPEMSGTGVRPQVVRDYPGGDLTLPGDTSKVIRVTENPALSDLTGCTLITTDGTTLLGADDKAGVAVIVETAAHLIEHPEIVHGPVRILLTCDEEIGRGVDHVDLAKLGAAVCYTLDGQGADEIDVETFSADLEIVTIRGINIHPSIAKGRMVNALRVAAAFVDRLPRRTMAPETTADRDGFIHPYLINGSVAEVTLRIILRDFETAALTTQADLLGTIATEVTADFPGCDISIDGRPQYRNMADGLKGEPRAIAYACRALERLGRQPKLTIVRGGTDGSRLTEMGLPTPNLSTGAHNPHSPLEWACLDEMAQAVNVLAELAQIWARGE